jgi:hypothetical protein
MLYLVYSSIFNKELDRIPPVDKRISALAMIIDAFEGAAGLLWLMLLVLL